MNRPREDLDEQEDSASLNLDYSQGHEQTDDIRLKHELQKCEELSLCIQQIQAEISDLRAQLSQRYWPELEARIQRLAIERDETLISWGQSILALCAQNGHLEVHDQKGKRLSLFKSNSLHSSTIHINSPASNRIANSQDERVLGEPSFSPYAETNDYSDKALETDGSLIASNELPSTAQDFLNQAEKSKDFDIKEAPNSEESEASDPGIHDAPSLSLTQFSLNELREQMLQPKWTASQPEDTEVTDGNSVETVLNLMKRLGRPKDLSQPLMKEHLLELESEVDCCQSWSSFEQDVQHAVVTLITSRLRFIQDFIGDSPFDQDRIAKMFRRLTRFSSDFRPGFIHGLSREKVPEFDSWKNDELQAWKRLEDILDIEPILPKLSPEHSEKLEHLKDLLSKEEEIPDFSNVLRSAVTDCLNSGFSQENPHLIMTLESHLSYLSGKRFKKLRLAASSTRF